MITHMDVRPLTALDKKRKLSGLRGTGKQYDLVVLGCVRVHAPLLCI